MSRVYDCQPMRRALGPMCAAFGALCLLAAWPQPATAQSGGGQSGGAAERKPTQGETPLCKYFPKMCAKESAGAGMERAPGGTESGSDGGTRGMKPPSAPRQAAPPEPPKAGDQKK